LQRLNALEAELFRRHPERNPAPQAGQDCFPMVYNVLRKNERIITNLFLYLISFDL
jgi:hypothetical protein